MSLVASPGSNRLGASSSRRGRCCYSFGLRGALGFGSMPKAAETAASILLAPTVITLLTRYTPPLRS